MAKPTVTLQADEILGPDSDDMMEAARSLGELQPKMPHQLTVTQERSLFGDIVTAQPIRVPRNEAKILLKIDAIAKAAGPRFFYRYPVRNKRLRTVEYIEGPTVKCTDAVLMSCYTNAAVESRTVPLSDGNYICYSRFCDWENGTSMTLGQLVPRSATLGGEDEERRQQIAHNVGQSKSRRNVIVAGLGEYVNRAFEGAKRNLIERIGRDIEKSRRVIAAELAKTGGPEILPRVERIYARKVFDWLAPDIARVYAELQAINDGMSSIDETWPLEPPPEPRRNDIPADKPSTENPSGNGGPAAAQPSSPPVSPTDGQPPDISTKAKGGKDADK